MMNGVVKGGNKITIPKHGDLIYEEIRTIKREKRKYYAIGTTFLCFILFLIIPVLFIPIKIVIVKGIFVFPFLFFTIKAYSIALFGINNLKIYNSGFVTPTSYGIKRNLKRDIFIPFDEINAIFTNPYSTKHLKQPYFSIDMKNRKQSFLIDKKIIKDTTKFLEILRKKVPIIERDLLYDDLTHVLADFYLPTTNLFVGLDNIVLKYYRDPVLISFYDVKKVSLRASWLLKMKNGERKGISGISLEDRWKVRAAFDAYKKNIRG